MTDHAEQLKKAGAAYRRARDRADQIMKSPREDLTAKVREAYAGGMRKADILRAIDHVWSRQWLDDTVRDISPPERDKRPRASTSTRAIPSIEHPDGA